MKRPRSKSESPISMQLAPRDNLYREYSAFTFLVLVASIILVTGAIGPAADGIRQLRWRAVPCRIVAAPSLGCGTANCRCNQPPYFTYRVDNLTYTTKAYNADFNISDEEEKRLSALYPLGKPTICYVNGNNAAQAVLQKSQPWLDCLESAALAVAFFGAAWMLRSWHRKRRRVVFLKAAWIPKPGSQSTLLREIGVTRRAQAIGSSFFATWFVVFLYFMLRIGTTDKATGKVSPVPLPIAIWFLLGTGVLIVIAVRSILACTNPRVRISLSSPRVRSGETVDLTWKISGGLRQISQLNISLEGREKSMRRWSTREENETGVFMTLPLFGQGQSSLGQTATAHQGTVRLNFPEGLIHSFQARNNQVVYAVKVHAPFRFWPDLKAEFELVVEPGAPLAGASD